MLALSGIQSPDLSILGEFNGLDRYERLQIRNFPLPGSLRLLQVVVLLETEPEFRACPEDPGQSQGSIRCDAAVPIEYGGDARRVDVHSLCQTIWSDSERLDEIGPENLSGMNISKSINAHRSCEEARPRRASSS